MTREHYVLVLPQLGNDLGQLRTCVVRFPSMRVLVLAVLPSLTVAAREQVRERGW